MSTLPSFFSRRKFLLILLGILGNSALSIFSLESKKKVKKNKLYIPQLIDSKKDPSIDLYIQHGKHEFYAGVKSKTMGFNRNYLGPTIRMYKGHKTHLTFHNKIDEPITVHGHGLHVSGDIDGGPQSLIPPNKKWKITIPVVQQAGMSWYHPHTMGETAKQVHAGLAGIYLIEDDNSQSLGLPNYYGIDDIPLVIQDRSFINKKMRAYQVSLEQMQTGLKEDTLVVNGTINGYIYVPKGWVRLRLLNGSNARFYEFSFQHERTFYKIATEGGLLNKPVPLKTIKMAPGERNEIMFNFADGKKVQLVAKFLDETGEKVWFVGKQQNVLEFIPTSSITAKGKLPKKLNHIKSLSKNDVKKVRTFTLEMEENDEEKAVTNRHNMFSINGKSMDMKVINEKVNKGEVEIWKIQGAEMAHPFHIHGTSFQILSQAGKIPALEDRGWKDTVVVNEETTEIIVRFDQTANHQFPYMYHCHILEHEDGGMMGQFTVS